MFVCFYCHKTAASKNQRNVEFNSFDELQAHLTADHGSQEVKFFAIGTAACFHCDQGKILGSFQRLMEHHRTKHETEIFVVVDQQNCQKCGLCQLYIDYPTAMVEHFKKYHHSNLLPKIFNPICFTQNEIDWLLKLRQNEDLEKLSQLENFQCGLCGKLRDTKTTHLERHLKGDKFEFSCKNCKFETEEIDKLISHEQKVHSSKNPRSEHKNYFMDRVKRIYFRTKLLFSNGLVVFKHNVLKTSFDDSSEFMPFIERFASQKFDESMKSIKSSKSTIQSNSFDAGIAKPDKRAFYEKQLVIQRRFKNKVCISGIFGIFNDNYILMNFFLEICKLIGATITSNDVSQIQYKKNAIIVTMVKYDMKRNILDTWEDIQNLKGFVTQMRSSEINGIPLSDFSIEEHLTHFFKPLKCAAEKAKKDKQILSCWMSYHGLKIKVDQQKKPEIIWSILDLTKLIEQSNNLN